MRVCELSHCSCVWLFVTPWTVARQAPLSIGFSRQEYWSGLPCPPPGNLPGPGIEPVPLMSPALAGEFFTTSTTWEALATWYTSSVYPSPFAPLVTICFPVCVCLLVCALRCFFHSIFGPPSWVSTVFFNYFSSLALDCRVLVQPCLTVLECSHCVLALPPVFLPPLCPSISLAGSS